MIRLGSGIPSAFTGFANIRSKVASTSRFVTEQVKRSFIGLLYVVGTERIWSVLLVGDSSDFYLAKAADKPPDGNQEKVQDRGSIALITLVSLRQKKSFKKIEERVPRTWNAHRALEPASSPTPSLSPLVSVGEGGRVRGVPTSS